MPSCGRSQGNRTRVVLRRESSGLRASSCVNASGRSSEHRRALDPALAARVQLAGCHAGGHRLAGAALRRGRGVPGGGPVRQGAAGPRGCPATRRGAGRGGGVAPPRPRRLRGPVSTGQLGARRHRARARRARARAGPPRRRRRLAAPGRVDLRRLRRAGLCAARAGPRRPRARPRGRRGPRLRRAGAGDLRRQGPCVRRRGSRGAEPPRRAMARGSSGEKGCARAAERSRDPANPGALTRPPLDNGAAFFSTWRRRCPA